MTWAIAMPGFPTGGVLLADVRVSFVDPQSRQVIKEKDCVQKVHPVASNLAIAFAGSVEAGFVIVEDLKGWLSGLSDGKTWSPAYVAKEWSRRLERLWNDLGPHITAGGCELLLVGAFPADPPPFAHSDAFRFRGPQFEMERLSRGHASSIGSGSEISVYKQTLESFADELDQLSGFSLQPFPGGPAGPMSVVLGELISKNPTPGISSQLVLCPVGVAETTIYTVNSPRRELSTPPIASTLEDFRKLCFDERLADALAIAWDSSTRSLPGIYTGSGDSRETARGYEYCDP